jgi:pyruvate,water dikinase
VTGDRSAIGIEASFGLGFAVVDGVVTPDRYVVDKVTLQLRSRAIATKPFAYGRDPDRDGVRRFDVPEPLRRSPCLAPEEVLEVALLGKSIEQRFGTPQDIEWAIAPGPTAEQEVWLLQARPETVWSRRPPQQIGGPGRPITERIAAALRGPVGWPDEAAPNRPVIPLRGSPRPRSTRRRSTGTSPLC